MAAPIPSKLDEQQCIQGAYDEANGRLRVDAALTADIIAAPGLHVDIQHTEDSVRLGDGTNYITSTTIGPDVGLDVNIINPISIEIDAADGDNVAIHDSDGDELQINADGSINVNATQSGVWTTGRTWTLSSGTDSVASVQSGIWNINDITGTISLPTGAATSANQLTEISHLASIDSDIDVSLSTRASEATLAILNTKFFNDYGVSSGAIRTASQIGNTTGAALFGAGTTTAQVLRVVLPTDQTAIPITDNGGSLTVDNNGTFLVQSQQSGSWSVNVNNFPTIVDTNYGTVGSNTIRTASQIGNSTGAADFNAGVTGLQTLRTTSNITRNGTELSYNFGAADANTLRAAALIGNATGAADFNAGAATAQTLRVTVSNFPTTLDTNYGTVGANTLRTAAQIGNATGAADFGAGATGTQTLRTSANLSDGAGTALTSTLFNSKQSLDVRPNTGFSTASNTRPLVSITSSTILAANLNRKYVILTNNEIKTIWIKLGTTAVATQGIGIPSGGAYEILSTNLWTGTIEAIVANGPSINIDIFEGT